MIPSQGTKIPHISLPPQPAKKRKNSKRVRAEDSTTERGLYYETNVKRSRNFPTGLTSNSEHISNYVCVCVCMLVAQSCLTLCNSMDCNLSGSSIHGIFLARILEWVAISFSRESSQPRDPTHISCIAGGLLTTEPPGRTLNVCTLNYLILPK